jgi:hypothetical protein
MKKKIKEMTRKGLKESDEYEVKVKLFLYYIKHNTTKTYGGVEVQH